VSFHLSFKATPDASQEGVISTKVGRKVIEVFFENGETVSRGATLVKLDDIDIRNNIKVSEAQLAATKAQFKVSQSQINSTQIALEKPQNNLATTERNYDRTKTLYDQGAAPKVDLENAESLLKAAQTDLETAKANLESMKQSSEVQKANIQVAQTNLNNLRESLSNTTITAPTSGVIDQKSVSLGQYVNAGTVLGKVKTIAPIYAVIEVQESDLNAVKVGEKASFKLDEKDLTTYVEVVKHMDAVADSASRLFKCKVQIDNKDQKLKPGIFGKVQIVTTESRKSITLPLKALGGSEGNYFVLINNNGIAKKQAITTGEIVKDTVEIKSGVKQGDSVICSNIGMLQDGDAVKVVSE